jgi:phytoene dehydrogenase-like protein
MAQADAIIVGGGHNGLACAGFLARGGMKVLLLEAEPRLGGMARTADLGDGFRVPELAHLLNMLHPKVASELRLERHGLALAAADLPTVALEPGREPLLLPSDPAAAEGLSVGDRQAWQRLRARLMRFAAALEPFRAEPPPRLGSGADRADMMRLARMGWAIRGLGKDEMREFLRIIAGNVADLVEDEVADPLLQAVVAFDAVLGTAYGPRAPGTVLTLLYRLAGGVAGKRGAVAVPRGGMGAVSDAFGVAAEAAGACLRLNAPVRRVVVEDGRASGVELADGERIAARVVVSNLDPHRTFLELVGPTHLDTGFVRRVANIRARGAAAKLNLALDGLPEPPGLERRHLMGRIVIAPSVAAIERAADAVKYKRYSERPAIEAVIPSLHDPELAPAGKHVLSAIVQYAPPEIEGGWTQAARRRFADSAMDMLERALPGLAQLVRARQLLLPQDIARSTGASFGHWHHGELAIDQMLMLRPVLGAQRYATPIEGLYLCGAGCHPGGGVMGAAGMNAARQILEREGRA